MNKLLATDLDGTLFYPKEKKRMIEDSNLKVLRDFADEGNEVVIISGRSLNYCLKVKKRVNRNVGLICFNGSLVYKDGKIIYSQALNNEKINDFINEIYEEYKLPGVFIMSENGMFVKIRSKNPIMRLGYIFYYKNQKVYKEDFHWKIEDYNNEIKNGKIFKIMFFFGITKKSKNKAGEINKIFRNTLEDYECNWSDNVIEVTAKNCSKANALAHYISKEKLENCRVFVVGDSGNDISMFKKYHENSFCINKAPHVIKKYAAYTIDKFSDLSRYIFEK
ncbi:MAG: Cof-type HAD-IIB family hydrolase [Mollicutes bacterium]|nr:Cof-type HAD-IIB family hydrolase [Mollicutes bacterium]MDD7264088.1 HAD family hydrolase [bacterium]MDY4978987.1 HAD family hydrolase [Candidatus Onthovivens sp.]